MIETCFFLLCWPAFSPQMVGIIWAVDTWEAIKLAIVICRILFADIISLWHQMCQDSRPHCHWHYRLSQLWWTFQNLTVACKHLKKEEEIKLKKICFLIKSLTTRTFLDSVWNSSCPRQSRGEASVLDVGAILCHSGGAGPSQDEHAADAKPEKNRSRDGQNVYSNK